MRVEQRARLLLCHRVRQRAQPRLLDERPLATADRDEDAGDPRGHGAQPCRANVGFKWSETTSKQLSASDAPSYPLYRYAFCARSGGVAVVYLNTHVSDVSLSFLDDNRDDGGLGKREVYVLTSSPGNLISRDIFLNSEVLELSADGKLPAIAPRELAAGEDVPVAAKSYGFVVFPDATAEAC